MYILSCMGIVGNCDNYNELFMKRLRKLSVFCCGSMGGLQWKNPKAIISLNSYTFLFHGGYLLHADIQMPRMQERI